jgi:hypothetical protein
MSRVPFLAVAVTSFAAFSPLASAQGEARIDHQKRAAYFNYGVPRVGKHTLDSLQVGNTWRMGANSITTFTVEAPLITADTIVPPGVYRVNIARPQAEKFELTIEGAGSRMAAGGDDVRVPVTLEMLTKANDKLEIELQPAKEQPDAELKAFTFRLQFGSPCVTAPMRIAGTQPQKAKGFTIDAFKLPEKWLGERLVLAKHTPVASLVRNGKAADGVPVRLNLLVSDTEALLVPAGVAPTENRGFGSIPVPDRKWTLKGTAAWSVAQKPSTHFRVDSVEIDKDGLLKMTAVCGEKQAAIQVATEPAKG